MKNAEEILSFLEIKLNTAGMSLNDSQKKQIRYATNHMYALSDRVIDFINSNLKENEISELKPDWLDVIDKYFNEQETTSEPPLNSFHLHQLLPIAIALMTPLVSIEHLIAMKSFSKEFISKLELAFMTRLNLPRSLDEAKRMYEIILTLPASSKAGLFKKRSNIDAPYLSQMLFALLIMRKTKQNSKIWNFQLECLKTCPKHLLDYGSISENKLSYRPSFWMAHSVSDKDFRRVLTERASIQYEVDLKKVLKYESSKAEAEKELAVNEDSVDAPLKERISGSQIELADLLIRFEELLKNNHPDVFRTLKPGASNDKINKLNEILAPLRLPEDFVTLYKWHNGIENNGYLFGFPEFISTEAALQQYREAIKFGEQFSWCKAWFTMSYDSRVYLLVPLSEDIKETSPIFYHDIEGGDIQVHYESVKQFIQTYIEAYSDGTIILDEESGYREFEEDDLEKIRLKNNPNAFKYKQNENACYDSYDSSNWPSEWKKYKIGD